jgi:hypothetical protein
MWSAAVDPYVLFVRALDPVDAHARLFDARSASARMVRGPEGEHLLIDRGGDLVRLDVVEGTTMKGPVALHFALADDNRIEGRIAAIRTLRATASMRRRHVRLAGRLLALQAVDARNAGASLKEVADTVLERGDWPGEGEYRKSHVRRLLDAGSRMIGSGPREILHAT